MRMEANYGTELLTTGNLSLLAITPVDEQLLEVLTFSALLQQNFSFCFVCVLGR